MCDFGGRVLSRATKYVILFYYHSYDGNANQAHIHVIKGSFEKRMVQYLDII
jgi:hypothetical protein